MISMRTWLYLRLVSPQLKRGEFAMGTGANKDKLYLTMHSDTI